MKIQACLLLAIACCFSACAVVDEAPPYPQVWGPEAAVDLDPSAEVAEYELNVGRRNIELVEGQPTEVWTYNGMSPGPVLHARVGETVKVHVTNNLSEATTVHWHGLRIAAAMDGVVHGSLLAIEPGETFTYEFVPPEAGTFWYHPHVRSSVQVESGLYGAFVVHEAEAKRPDVDVDRLFVLDDVRLNADGSIAQFYDSGMDVMHGRSGNVLLTNGREHTAEVEMIEGRVERWRLVNTANARTLTLHFPGLEVTQMGADAGLWTRNLHKNYGEGDRLVLPVGARADLEVRLAAGQSSGTMQALVLALDENDNVVEVPLDLVQTAPNANLKVTDRAGFQGAPSYVLPEADMNSEPTHEVVLSGYNDNGTIVFTINDMAWPDYPEWTVPAGQLQVIDVTNLLGMEHPFHLHGQWFTVLSINGQPARTPGLRDTVLLEGGDSLRIATTFDNPGTWMYHCHILEHAEAGMMALVNVTGDSQ